MHRLGSRRFSVGTFRPVVNLQRKTKQAGNVVFVPEFNLRNCVLERVGRFRPGNLKVVGVVAEKESKGKKAKNINLSTCFLNIVIRVIQMHIRQKPRTHESPTRRVHTAVMQQLSNPVLSPPRSSCDGYL